MNNINLYNCVNCNQQFFLENIKSMDYCPNCENNWFIGKTDRYGKLTGEIKFCKICKLEKDLIFFSPIKCKNVTYYGNSCRQCIVLSKREKYNYKECQRPHFYLENLEYGFYILKLKENTVFFDKGDYYKIKDYYWAVTQCEYNTNSPKYVRGKLSKSKKRIFMHRLILDKEIPKDKTVDHINRNGLDNRRSNLRFATMSENIINREKQKNTKSQYKGVTLSTDRKYKPWISKITKNRKIFYLGRYHTSEEAAKVYDKAALELHGEFARLNFPPQVNLQSNNNSNTNNI